MKRRLCALALTVLLMFLLLPPGTARADNDDFNVDYDFSPDLVGNLGADMNLLLTVENTGPTDITWIGVGIDTEGNYSARWNGRIPPGASRRLSFNVPFSMDDVQGTRLMQVVMNNDSDAGADGSKTFRFSIRWTYDVFSISHTISPDLDSYRTGDTITVTMRYRNNMTTHAATGVVTELFLTRGGERLTDLPPVDQGTIMPGQYKTATLTYTLREADAGGITICGDLRGRMMGRDYHIGRTTPFNVIDFEPIPGHTLAPGGSSGSESPEVIFTASLSAEPVVIDAGDTVRFRVTVRNTGDDDIGGFEITDMGGATELNAEGMAAGADGSVIISKSISETCDMRFVVIGRTGDLSVSKQTNAVHITVRETPETEIPSPAAAATEEALPSATEMQPSAAPDETAAAVLETPAGVQAQPLPGIPTAALLIVIAVLLIATVALLTVLLLRKKR